MQEKLVSRCSKNWSVDAGKTEILPLGPDLRPAWIWSLGLRSLQKNQLTGQLSTAMS